jgi:pilus assembly protein FimV
VRSAPRREAAETYKIKRGDTLGAIARKRKPDGVTLNQMLIALHQTNRNVFIRDNINLIRAGGIITIPGRDEVAAIDSADAFRRVISQMADFARYRRHQGATVAAASMRPASGQRDVISRRVAVRKAVRSM